MYFRSDDRISIVTRISCLTYLCLLLPIWIVSGMRFKKQPQSGVIPPGEDVILRCSVNKPYTTDVFWKNIDKDMYLSQNTFMEPEKRVNITSMRERYSIVGNQDKGEYFLRITGFNAGDEGRYACEFFMNRTYQSRIAELRIATPPDSMYPICTIQPTGSYAVGDSITLYCESVGGTPPASLALRRGSEILRIYLPFGHLPESLVTHTLTLTESDMNRRYTCVSRHPALTDPRSCSFMPLRDRVGLYLRPLVAKVMEMEDTVFTCISERLPNLTFTWYIDDVVVDGTNPLVQIDETGHRLLLYNVTMEFNFALVTCKVIQVGPGYKGIATSLVSVEKRPVETTTVTTMAPASSTTPRIPSVTPSLDDFSGSGSGDASLFFSTHGGDSSSSRTIPGSTAVYRMTKTTKSFVPTTSTTAGVPPSSKVATDDQQDVTIGYELEKDYGTSSSNAVTLSTFNPANSDMRDNNEESRSGEVKNTVTSQVPTSSYKITERPEAKRTKGITSVASTVIPQESASMSTEYSENAKSSKETSTYGWSSSIISKISKGVSTSAVAELLSTIRTTNVTTNEPSTSQTDVSNEQQTITENMSTVEPLTVTVTTDVKDVIDVRLSTKTSTYKSSTISNEEISTEAFGSQRSGSESSNPIFTTIMTPLNDIQKTERIKEETSKTIGIEEDVNTVVTTIVTTKDVTKTVTSKGKDGNTATITFSTMGDLEANGMEASNVPITTVKVMPSFEQSTDIITKLDEKSTESLKANVSSMPPTASIVTDIKTTAVYETDGSTSSLETNLIVINATEVKNSSDVSNTSISNEILDIGNHGGETEHEIPNDTNFVEKDNFVDPNSSKSFSFDRISDKFWHYAIIVTTVAVLCISVITITSVVIISKRIGPEQADTTAS